MHFDWLGQVTISTADVYFIFIAVIREIASRTDYSDFVKVLKFDS